MLTPDEIARAAVLQADLHAQTADNDGPISDDDLARRFTERHGDVFRYVAALGRWFMWVGSHWKQDDSLAVFDAARASCRRDLGQALVDLEKTHERKQLRSKLGAAPTVAAVERLARSDRCHAVTLEALDADPWLLNTPGGVLDLRTGALRPSNPSDLITKITAAAPMPECPTFQRVLERALPDVEVREYVQRLVGYCLTGEVRESIVALVYGTGGNGKSLIFNAIRYALRDYAITLGSEVLMESHNDRHPTEIAVLRGARMALCSEVDSGRRWNEARLKRLSGGDPITARLINRDPFEFQPTHKLIMLANVKPGLRTVDEAIRRRIHLIEFNQTIPPEERDPTLPEKLKAEAGGILTWALVGCLDWRDGGLRPPQSVLDATDRYLDQQDAVAEWMRDCCRPLGQMTLTAAHAAYRVWAEANAIPPLGRNSFGDQLQARGVEWMEVRPRVRVFSGLSLAKNTEVRHAG
jgi:P4 family phage/plasmid primase-like protien